jgi:hypothetical protein
MKLPDRMGGYCEVGTETKVRKYHLWQRSPAMYLKTVEGEVGGMIEFDPKTQVILTENGMPLTDPKFTGHLHQHRDFYVKTEWITKEEALRRYPSNTKEIAVKFEEDAGRHPSYDEGVKFDDAKNRLDLIPVEALEQVGEIYSYGAKKYADHNWRSGLKFSRLYGATLRHLFAFWRGEDKDKESGLPHLAHATFGLLGLLQYQAEGRRELDDRFTWAKERITEVNEKRGAETKEPVREVGLSRETETLVAEQDFWSPAHGLATRL